MVAAMMICWRGTVIHGMLCAILMTVWNDCASGASARQRADYLRESIQRINRADPQPGEDEELKGRRARIENAADIAQGVSRALAALDASQVDVDADSSSASDLLNQAISSLRDIHVDGDFGELADRLESLNADLSDIVFSLSRELDGEESVEDLDAITRASTSWAS